MTPDAEVPEPMPPRRPRLARGVRMQRDEVRGQTMLLFPEGALVLNPTAAGVIELCDGERTVADIVAVLEERYRGADLEQDIRELLKRIEERRLLVHDNDP